LKRSAKTFLFFRGGPGLTAMARWDGMIPEKMEHLP
jgi:hypothetical protein